jgi:hypothetical protein
MDGSTSGLIVISWEGISGYDIGISPRNNVECGEIQENGCGAFLGPIHCG